MCVLRTLGVVHSADSLFINKLCQVCLAPGCVCTSSKTNTLIRWNHEIWKNAIFNSCEIYLWVFWYTECLPLKASGNRWKTMKLFQSGNDCSLMKANSLFSFVLAKELIWNLPNKSFPSAFFFFFFLITEMSIHGDGLQLQSGRCKFSSKVCTEITNFLCKHWQKFRRAL